MSSANAKLLPGKRKASSTSSAASESCASPEHSEVDQSLKQSLNDQEQRVYGVTECQGDRETVDHCVDQCVAIFTKKVGVSVSKTDIEIAHRAGKPGGTRPRPIIVRFHSRRARGMVLEKRRRVHR
ncbi:hypothetical protein ACOMHN_010016 [Nucella lapillus]